jgi:hypothetical protein
MSGDHVFGRVPPAPPGQEGQAERPQEISRSIRQARRGGGSSTNREFLLEVDPPPRPLPQRIFGNFLGVAATPPGQEGWGHPLEYVIVIPKTTKRRAQPVKR